MSFQSLLLPLIIVLFAVPLFLGTRKQKRAVAQQQEMQNALSFGDRVMTTSGLYATVVSHDDTTIDLEIAPGVVTTWLRAAVREKVDPTSEVTEVDSDEEYEDVEETTDEAVVAEKVEDAVPAPITESAAEIAPPLESGSKKAR